MMELRFAIDVDDFSCTDDDLPAPAGVSIEDAFRENLDLWGLREFTLNIILPVAASVVANWLYDKLKKHGAKSIRINRQQITVDRGKIERIIREEIEIRQ